jgi:hypothetical protein
VVTDGSSVIGVILRAMFQRCMECVFGVHGSRRGCSNWIFLFDASGHCEGRCSQAVDAGQ